MGKVENVREYLVFKTHHSGEEGYLSEKKFIIDMSYIFEKVLKNAIKIHWNLNFLYVSYDFDNTYI